MQQIKDLRVIVFDRADKSDPLNILYQIGVRGFVGGKRVGWVGRAEWSLRPGESQATVVERAIENLLKQMIAIPNNPLPDDGHPQLAEVE